jgi:hypothetical protein
LAAIAAVYHQPVFPCETELLRAGQRRRSHDGRQLGAKILPEKLICELATALVAPPTTRRSDAVKNDSAAVDVT